MNQLLNQFVDAPFSLFLLLINILIGVYAISKDPSLVGRMAFTPSRIRDHGEYYRVITGSFVHAGLGHLAVNMITLYYFGPYLELTLGSWRFLVLYFGAGLAASALSYLMHRTNDKYSSVGASGSIAGLVFAFCMFQPFFYILLFFVLPLPAWFFALAFVVFSVYAMRRKSDGKMDRIAHEAHLGGAFGGALITILVRPDVVARFLSQIGF